MGKKVVGRTEMREVRWRMLSSLQMEDALSTDGGCSLSLCRWRMFSLQTEDAIISADRGWYFCRWRMQSPQMEDALSAGLSLVISFLQEVHPSLIHSKIPKMSSQRESPKELIYLLNQCLQDPVISPNLISNQTQPCKTMGDHSYSNHNDAKFLLYWVPPPLLMGSHILQAALDLTL